MEESKFWQVIGECSFENDLDVYLQEVIDRLSLTSIPNIYQFERKLQQKMKLLCNWNCYGVFLLIETTVDDEKFHDFRLWIIAKGEVFYNKFSQDPELVADDLLAAYNANMPYFQGLSLVSGHSLLKLNGIFLSKLNSINTLSEEGHKYFSAPRENNFNIGISYGFIMDVTGEKLLSDEDYQHKFPKIFDGTEGEFLRYKESHGL